MLNTARLPFKMELSCIAFLAVCSLALNAAVPRGWYVAGSKPADYEAGVDAQGYEGHPNAYLKAKRSTAEGFGTLMQDFDPHNYAGKRVRFSALVKAEEVNGWAGLWLRIDKGSTSVGFDNMQDRPIKGTTGWQNYKVVLDVPQDATGIAFGILLSGSGTVWLNSVKFEPVKSDVPLTGPTSTHRPTNRPT